VTVAAHASPPDASPRPSGEQDYVLSGRPLRPGTSLGSTARFGDDWWDLRPAQLQHQDKALSLNFANVPERYRADAKDLFRLLLNGPHPVGVAEMSIGTIRQKFSALASFWRWLDDRAAGPGSAMATLAGRDLEDYHRHILATTRSRSLRAHRKSAVRLLWFYRRQISDGLAFDPSHLDDWAEPHADGRGENRSQASPRRTPGRTPRPAAHPASSCTQRNQYHKIRGRGAQAPPRPGGRVPARRHRGKRQAPDAHPREDLRIRRKGCAVSGQPAVWLAASVLPPLGALRTAPATARGHVRGTLTAWRLSELSDTVELVVSRPYGHPARLDGIPVIRVRPMVRPGSDP
jgi:hypothetical protein